MINVQVLLYLDTENTEKHAHAIISNMSKMMHTFNDSGSQMERHLNTYIIVAEAPFQTYIQVIETSNILNTDCHLFLIRL
jgi:hypothetical protein